MMLPGRSSRSSPGPWGGALNVGAGAHTATQIGWFRPLATVVCGPLPAPVGAFRRPRAPGTRGSLASAQCFEQSVTEIQQRSGGDPLARRTDDAASPGAAGRSAGRVHRSAEPLGAGFRIGDIGGADSHRSAVASEWRASGTQWRCSCANSLATSNRMPSKIGRSSSARTRRAAHTAARPTPPSQRSDSVDASLAAAVIASSRSGRSPRGGCAGWSSGASRAGFEDPSALSLKVRRVAGS
jgi:hypothetical protein